MQDRKIEENIQIIYKNINKQLVQLVLQTPVSRLQTPVSTLQTPVSTLQTADSRLQTLDSRFGWLIQFFNVLNFDLFFIVCAKLNILVTFSVFLRLLGDAS